MRYILALAAVLLAVAPYLVKAGDPGATACEAPDPTIVFTGPNHSVDELEALGLELAARNPAAPQVPFAYGHRAWLRMKAAYRTGDRLIAFAGPHYSDGAPIAWGYALLRGQCLVRLLVTRRA